MEIPDIYLGTEYNDKEIFVLLENFKQKKLIFNFLKDRAKLYKVILVYSLNEWKEGEPFNETEMIYNSDEKSYFTTVDFGNAPSICYRFKILETPEYIRWEDRNQKNWYFDTSQNIFFTIENNIEKKVAQLIADRNVVAWFQGRSEFGPRALGNRSLLAHPGDPEIKKILNSEIKKREWFRPYAPSVLYEYQKEFFDTDIFSPFMLFTAKVIENKKNLIPAVVHIDGTSRIQSVTRKMNKRFYDLIENFRKITGIPMVLNTSFNEKDFPIVETPFDALRTFMNMPIKYMALNNYMVVKK